jgi:PAS domain S-box-containing protein
MGKPSYEQLREKVERLERELSLLKASSTGGDAQRQTHGGRDMARKDAGGALPLNDDIFGIAFQRSPLLLAISSIADGRFIDVNDRFLEVIGVRKDEVIGTSSMAMGLFAVPGERDIAIGRISETGHIEDYEVHIRTRHGEIRRGLFNAEVITLRGGKYLLTMMNDVTDFKKTQERLQESEGRYRLLAENARDVIWLTDLDMKPRYISPSVQHLVGLTSEEMMKRGFDEFLLPESRGKISELFAKNRAIEESGRGDPARTITIELEIIRSDASIVWTESLLGFQRDKAGRPRSIVGITRDISERKAASERLRGQLALNMALAGLAGSIISRSFSLADIASIVLEYARVLTDSEHGFVTEIDPVTGDNTVLSTTKMPGAESPGILYKMPGGAPDGAGRTYPGIWGHVLNTRQPFFTNDPARHPAWHDMRDDAPRYGRLLSVPVIFGNEPVGEIGVVDASHDYTDDDLLVVRRLASLYAMAINRLRSEQQLNNSLREKEILIKELHHRVKNNLQVISSLLSLQMRRVDDERYRSLFQESQNRIHAMALVHEKLYHSEIMTRIDFGKYINELTQHLFYSYNINRHLVRLDLDVKEVFLGIDVAVPCAMIVNELISNSLKHAFPDGRKGIISVTLSLAEGGKHLLAVSDDGIGMPGDFDPGKTDSLGMQIVHSLARQIRGTIDISRGEGTRVSIVF